MAGAVSVNEVVKNNAIRLIRSIAVCQANRRSFRCKAFRSLRLFNRDGAKRKNKSAVLHDSIDCLTGYQMFVI